MIEFLIMNEASRRRSPLFVSAALLALAVGACSDTWHGAKEDTRDNVKATGQAIERAGETIERQTE